MTRTSLLLAAVSVVALGFSAPAMAETAGTAAGANSTTQVEAQQKTGFFGSVGNTVKGWFSSDNDAVGRADMEANPAYNNGTTSLNSAADVDAQADLDAAARNNARTAPAAGTATQDTRAGVGLNADVNLGAGADANANGMGGHTTTGVDVDANVGGGTATGMGTTGTAGSATGNP